MDNKVSGNNKQRTANSEQRTSIMHQVGFFFSLARTIVVAEWEPPPTPPHSTLPHLVVYCIVCVCVCVRDMDQVVRYAGGGAGARQAHGS